MKAISQLFPDCGLPMTNLQKIILAKIVDFVPESNLRNQAKFIVDFIWQSLNIGLN